MVRALKAAALIAAIVAVACGNPPPRTVVVVQPYVAILPLDTSEHHLLGKSGCDLNGVPVIWLHPLLTIERARWVMKHEQIHVAQSFANGGCRAFITRYRDDPAFRLASEVSAYCGVLQAQLAAKVQPDPLREDIPGLLLMETYGDAWTEPEIRLAMAC